MNTQDFEIPAEKLKRSLDPASLGIKSTAEVELLEGIIGQPRAVEALRFGLGIGEIGFNIYLAGPPGIGKMSALQSFLEQEARRKETPSDWCYLHNFADPYQPRACKLPRGRARELKQDMTSLIDHARQEIPKAFESEEYGNKRDQIVKDLEKQRTQMFERMTERAGQSGFILQSTPLGIAVTAAIGPRAMSEQEMHALSAAAREEIEKRRETVQEDLKNTLKSIREIERAAREKTQDLDRQVALYVVGGLIDDLADKYVGIPQVSEYLDAVKADLMENIQALKGQQQPQLPSLLAQPPAGPPDAQFRKYEVNVLVDNSRQEGAPVVAELNPTVGNLFGRIERESHYGTLYTDFTMIKAGSLHRANGGYLVLRIEDLARSLFSWEDLKRALRSREIALEEPGERLGFQVVKSLKPQPIPLDLKVVLVGRPLYYYLLHAYDEDFAELFKVKADFDMRMDWRRENIQDFLSFLGTFCRKESLRHLDAGGASRLLEHAARLAEDQAKISTHFGAIADVVREAGYWAERDSAEYAGAKHVQNAIDAKTRRSNLIEERMQELFERGTILVDVEGEAVGQVNGLSVLRLGDYMFGKPSRITASAAPGREGIIDIEREVKMGGPIHSKGVMILSGYMASTYAYDKVLTLAARLVFEQSYEGVEGDSASSTELYALLSALSGTPIKQGIAVTGSVNQRGEVQPIGGVNEKIEGFFDVCKAKGLTGQQGVLIPKSNLTNLMLREDVIESVRAGRFHIWAVGAIDEGIELLTGIPAGKRGGDGKFPEGTIGEMVDRRLRAFAESVRGLAQGAQKATNADGAAVRNG